MTHNMISFCSGAGKRKDANPSPFNVLYHGGLNWKHEDSPRKYGKLLFSLETQEAYQESVQKQSYSCDVIIFYFSFFSKPQRRVANQWAQNLCEAE